MKHQGTIKKTIAVLLVLAIVLLSGCTSKKNDTTETSTEKENVLQASYNTKARNVEKNVHGVVKKPHDIMRI